ncbi:MAG: nuclear transport factor 2 family protein [Thermoleophilaceae bacterium]
MDGDNLEVVRRAFGAIQRRDSDSLIAGFDASVHIRSLLTEAEGPDFRGHDGAREWLHAVLDVFPDWSPHVESVRSLDGGVVSALHVVATSVLGVPIDQVYWHATRVSDGRIVFFGFFRSEAEAVEALSAG